MSNKRKGNTFIEMIAVIALVAIFLSASYLPDPETYVLSIQEKDKVERLVMLDQLLYQWAESHAHKFPQTLKELKFLGVEEESIRLYQYKTNVDNTKYQLYIEVSNGKNISPKSINTL